MVNKKQLAGKKQLTIREKIELNVKELKEKEEEALK